MKRKSVFAAIISLLFSLGALSLQATSASASALPGKVPWLSSPPAPIQRKALENAGGTTPWLQSRLHATQPLLGSARMIKPLSTPFSTNIVQPVDLTLMGPGQVDLTKPIVLSGFLQVSTTGEAVTNKTITFSTGEVYLGQTHTDDQGRFIVKINKDLEAGKYVVTAQFNGAHVLSPASDAVGVEILPASVRIQTVPAVEGVTFRMDGRKFSSGADGFASIDINQPGKYRLDVLLDEYHNPSQQVKFGRWSEETFQPSRSVEVPADHVIEVGLNVFHKINFKFIDLDGFSVDPGRITSISIRSVQGDVFTLRPGDTPWLPASRTARRHSGLEVTDLLYSVNSVTMDGSNVVNSAQQRFFAKPDDTWTISLLLYSLHITARDALFAAPVGTSVDIAFPNGQFKNYPISKSGGLEIHALARGIYRISISGVKGLGTTTPVALSRNQVVNLKIMTQMDITVIGLIGVGFALGLIFYGRPWLLQVMFRRKRYSSRSIRWTSTHEN